MTLVLSVPGNSTGGYVNETVEVRVGSATTKTYSVQLYSELPLPTVSDFSSYFTEDENVAIASALSQTSAGTKQEFHEISVDVSQPEYFYQAIVMSNYTDGG